MPSPILTIANARFRGRRIAVNGSYVFAGPLTMEYFLIGETGETRGPFPITAIENNNFSFVGPVAPGKWSFRIVAKPTDDSDVAQVVTEARKLTRAVGRSVMPEFRGSPVDSEPLGGVSFDPLTRKNYRTYVTTGSAGTRRMAAATSISSLFGPNPVLRIFRDNRQVFHVEFDGALVPDTDVNGDISLKPAAVKESIVIQAADLSSGLWRFVLQGGPSLSREISGTVGPAGAGKHLTLHASPADGMGFTSEFKFTFPRSIDGLT